MGETQQPQHRQKSRHWRLTYAQQVHLAFDRMCGQYSRLMSMKPYFNAVFSPPPHRHHRVFPCQVNRRGRCFHGSRAVQRKVVLIVKSEALVMHLCLRPHTACSRSLHSLEEPNQEGNKLIDYTSTAQSMYSRFL
jgi:hypothetical protein